MCLPRGRLHFSSSGLSRSSMPVCRRESITLLSWRQCAKAKVPRLTPSPRSPARAGRCDEWTARTHTQLSHRHRCLTCLHTLSRIKNALLINSHVEEQKRQEEERSLIKIEPEKRLVSWYFKPSQPREEESEKQNLTTVTPTLNNQRRMNLVDLS